MRFLTNADVERVIGPAEARQAVRAAFTELAAGTGEVHGRERTAVGDVKLSTLGGVMTGDGVLGAKVYSTIGGQFTFLVVLFAADDGRRLAILESDVLTRYRTAAVSVLGTELLARPDVRHLVVFGGGTQAQGHVPAFAEAFGLEGVTLVTRTPRDELAEALAAASGVPVTATQDAESALAEADVVVTATRSVTPLFPAAWLPDGVHVSAVGTSRPDCVELEVGVYERADRVVAEWTPQARREAGGLIHAVEAGVLAWSDVVDLADVLAGRAAGRSSAADVTVLPTTGIGIEDVAVAAAVWRRAEAEGVGQFIG
jgi:ornithine cyclodeaminase